MSLRSARGDTKGKWQNLPKINVCFGPSFFRARAWDCRYQWGRRLECWPWSALLPSIAGEEAAGVIWIWVEARRGCSAASYCQCQLLVYMQYLYVDHRRPSNQAKHAGPEFWGTYADSLGLYQFLFIGNHKMDELVRNVFPQKMGVRSEFLLITPHWLKKWFTQRWLSIRENDSPIVLVKRIEQNSRLPIWPNEKLEKTTSPSPRSASKTVGEKVIRQQKNLVNF